MAHVSHIWTSPGKSSGRMDGHDGATVLESHGLEGCAHGGRSAKRQILFASAEHLRSVGVEPGAIRENFTVEGVDVHTWPVGARVRVGETEFEITEECEPCHKMDALRPGLRAELEHRRGMLASVVRGGDVAVGDEVELVAGQLDLAS
jgi:MOSC domain-containing protein YiiM